jgi:hypothetical protein
MAINPVTGSAVVGIQRGLQGVRRAASDIARNTDPSAAGDYARSLVEMKQHAVQTRASTRALKAYNENLGTLLDIHA